MSCAEPELLIRQFRETDAASVQALFVLVNRQLAPPGARDAFEAYIARSITEEMGRIEAYYRERSGGFWVAIRDAALAGMFGLERVERTGSDGVGLERTGSDAVGVESAGPQTIGPDATAGDRIGPGRARAQAMELRRMYVHPSLRRGGIGRSMLQFAEAECRRRGVHWLELSTSELQPAALGLYRRAGYCLLREEIADRASHKTVGGGIRRYYFVKHLCSGMRQCS